MSKSKFGGAPVGVFVSLLVLLLVGALFIVGNFSSGNFTKITGNVVGNNILDEGECMLTDDASCTGTGFVKIIRLSSSSNAHGELGTGNIYTKVVCCRKSGLLGTCRPYNSNALLFLSGVTNAHTSLTSSTSYSSAVCVQDTTDGAKFQKITSGSCPTTAPKILLSLSGNSNAHLSYGNGYPNGAKVCTNLVIESGAQGGDCESAGITTNTQCLAPGNQCSWYPPKSTETNVGKCCIWEDSEDGIHRVATWNSVANRYECVATDSTCNSPWTKSNQVEPHSVKDVDGDDKYDQNCAKIDNAGTFGIWESVVPYGNN